MKFAVLVISPPDYIHSQAFQEVAELLHFGLLALGHDSIITTTVELERLPIVLGSNLLLSHPISLPANSILYNLEQVSQDSAWINSSLLHLFQQFSVWDYSLKNIQILTQLGINHIQHVPIGYVPELTRIKHLDEVNQDIDVLFYGSLNRRRLEIIEALQVAGIRVEVAFGIYGVERDQLIARSKIILNLHFYAAQVFEIVRVSYLLANQKLVVSEQSEVDPDSYALRAGIVFADYENIVKTCLQFLALPRRRQQIAEVGFNLMRQRSQVAYLRSALQILESPG